MSKINPKRAYAKEILENFSDIGSHGVPLADDDPALVNFRIREDGSLENRRYVLRGKVKYKMLCRNDGEVSVCDCELPFKYEAELGELDVAGACADIRVMGARVRCDG